MDLFSVLVDGMAIGALVVTGALMVIFVLRIAKIL